MPVIYRPKRFSLLNPEQQRAKLAKDRDYEIAHLNLTADSKKGKLDEAEFNTRHAQQWKDYVDWAIAQGLYDTVSVEQQLTEATDSLTEQVNMVNQLRQELGRKAIETVEEK